MGSERQGNSRAGRSTVVLDDEANGPRGEGGGRQGAPCGRVRLVPPACTGGTPLLVDRTATGPNRDADGRAGNRFSYDARWVTNENKSSARESLYCKHGDRAVAVRTNTKVVRRRHSTTRTERRAPARCHGARQQHSSPEHALGTVRLVVVRRPGSRSPHTTRLSVPSYFALGRCRDMHIMLHPRGCAVHLLSTC